jgi:branched-chain amino acid transport system substrate-binding protein
MEAAKKYGIKVLGSVNLPLKPSMDAAKRAALQIASMKPDFVWCGNTIYSCALLAKALVEEGVKTFMVVNVWGFDERFPSMSSPSVAGMVAGVSPWMWPEYARNEPGYSTLYKAAEMEHIPASQVNLRFMQGFINVWLLVKAIERTTSKQLLEMGGAALKQALESSCSGMPIRLGNITPPMRFCPGRHLAFTSAYIVVYGKDGRMHFYGPVQLNSTTCYKYAG